MRTLKYLLLLTFVLSLTPALAQDAPVRGGVVRGACVAAITSLDPMTSLLGVCDTNAYNLLYNNLVRVTDLGEVLPEVATEWTISEDGLTYTFTIREGIQFTDGTALDAAAVKFSLDRVRDPESGAPAATFLQVIDSIEAPDAQTVVITLKNPSAPFLAQVGQPIVSPTAVEAAGEDFQLQPVGSGPFKLVSWTPGDVAVFERNENYWEMGEDGEPLPYLDGVELNGVPDETVRLLNLQSGSFELNERNNPKDVAAIQADPSLQILPSTSGTAYQIAMNVTQPPFDNMALRQAVQAALQREAIITNVGFGTGYVVPYPFPRDVWFSITEPSPVYDTALVQEKLIEAGYPDGIDINLSIISRPIDEQIAQIVKANLDSVNIRVTLESLERTAWVDRWSNRQGEMGILQRGVSVTDPDTQSVYFDPANFANFAGYDNAEAWELVQQSRQTTDQAERVRLFTEAVAIMVEEAPYVFIGIVPVTASARSNLNGVILGPGSDWVLTRAWLAQ